MRFVVSYDISHDRRRQKVARILLRFGMRIQESVFLVNLDSDQKIECRRELGMLLSKGDLLEFFPIDTRQQDHCFAWQQQTSLPPSVLVID
jgi:CRISPR-associated protein Cas2